MRKIGLILLILVVLTESCAVSRKAHKTVSDAEIRNGNILEAVLENNISNNNFYIQKATITVTQNEISAKFLASLKFRKPDTILLVLKSKLGIEAGRAFITHDTILVNDRVNKKLMTGDPKKIKTKYGIEPAMLNIILGDMIINENDKERKINCSGGISSNDFNVGSRKIEYTIDCRRGKISKAYIEGDVTSGNIDLEFRDFLKDRNLIRPGLVVINDDLTSMKIEMKIEKMEIGWNGKIDFVPGNGYKIVRLK
ncbi:MAG: DUF4292 domain-containing protein [Bacteroidota bacterium]|nr:DUF4292 domain-containing protein [Bacteroidota bacterium]